MENNKSTSIFSKSLGNIYLRIMLIIFILFLISCLLGYNDPYLIFRIVIGWTPYWVLLIFITYSIKNKTWKIISIILETVFMLGMMLMLIGGTDDNYRTICDVTVADKKK